MTHRAASAKNFNALDGRHLQRSHSTALKILFLSLILVRRALFSLFAFAFLFRTHSGLTSTLLTSMVNGIAVTFLVTMLLLVTTLPHFLGPLCFATPSPSPSLSLSFPSPFCAVLCR